MVELASMTVGEPRTSSSWAMKTNRRTLVGAMHASFPEWIVPMAATLTQERFTAPEWVFERKYDGIRLLAFKRGSDVRLLSRNRLPQSCPPIARAIAELPVGDLILDGEITWRNAVEAFRETGRDSSGAMTYYVFDIMWIDGRDVTMLPLDERRALLRRLPLRSPLDVVAPLDEARPWERACAEGWEGVIAKRRDSRYEQRRSPHWLKMKCEARRDFIVGGFTEPQGTRVGLGALLVGHHEQGDFVFAGKVGTGFDTQLLRDLRARLDTIEIPQPPFTKGVGLPRVRAHWVQPHIVVEVAFIEWTVHGKLRHPRLLRVHEESVSAGAGARSSATSIHEEQ
jgi:bifunctional non-homologous end joining protein LigD